MLEQLFNLVKGSANDAVIKNTDVPDDHNNEVIAEATNTVASGLRNVVAGGGLQSIISLFTNKDQQGAGNKGLLSNAIVNMMTGHFAGKLMSKFNLADNKASNVAHSLIPAVIGNLIHKTNDPANNGFSLEGLLNSITGGKSNEVIQEQENSGNSGFNFRDLIGQFTGGGQQNTGGNGIMDIISKLAGGAQAQQQKNGSGGLMDLIRGFIK